MALLRKHSKPVYITFMAETNLPRAPGKGPLDNPSSTEFYNWSWSNFRSSFISVFQDPNLNLKITMHLATWTSASFKCPNDAIMAHLLLMKDLQYSILNLSDPSPLTLPQLCALNINSLRATISLEWATRLAIFVTMRNSFKSSSPPLPYNILEMNYEVLVKLIAELSLEKAQEETYFSLNKPKATSNQNNNSRISSIETAPNTNVAVNAIQSSSDQRPSCDYCKRPGHLESGCFTKNPDLLKKFPCKICKQTGHFPIRCPSKNNQ